MKSTPSVFQFVVLAVFVLVGIVGVVVFAGFGGLNGKKVPQATVWGTVPETQFSELVRQVNAGTQVMQANYSYIPADQFRDRFVNALAEGNGPDIVLIGDELLYSEQGKLMTIPYTTYDERTFVDTYIRAADHFRTTSGILGIPFSIDPLVMYYNRSMLASAGIAEAPRTWKEVEAIVPRITRLNETKGILKATVALGESRNIEHAKDIIVTMLMQAGNPITRIDPVSGVTMSVIDEPGERIESPGVSVIDFYTRFSNPVLPQYTWSRSMPDSKQAFLSGDLAIYFGFASELESIRLKNPNLDIDVVPVPQNSVDTSVTYGKTMALSIAKNSRNAQDAFDVIRILTDVPAQQIWVDISRMPPVRRDMLAQIPTDRFLSTFYISALQAMTWSDPDPELSTSIFRDMIETVTTGLAPASQAITTAKQRLDLLLQGITS
jgi:ABC-type glycerol-3-phosphate transport system substrate-binding protein